MYQDIAQKIIELKNADFELREKLIQNGKLSEGYNPEMEKLHNKNAKELEVIISQIGYPSIDKVGEEASQSAWIIIQHAIAQPDFMRKCAKELEKAVNENKADPINLAYLTDRIAVFEGKPQLYGTQFDWDENGEMSPNSFDDLTKVNERRKQIGFNTLEEQIKIMRKRVKDENQLRPIDFEKRKLEMEEWRKKTGWIK
ncbi:DUF6624 domain-containing protein [Flavobacterium phragmitis]|uniref:Uncharacterized protein n=1 Tax=Flavobacterium phragmitis TaxID=739143 RepID=A0A1I1VPA0_9FLAO|nr:DUF6624 domain-containing protein [Flavobacterium phragmitis]SFD84922.1 hypothetical protein SAMN05216297_11341 [Flavobacterium phragmitis]